MKENKKQLSKDSLQKVIKRRNDRLINFFKNAIPKEIGEVKIIGDENCPAVILNDEYCLSCYVHNFDLRLISKDKDGEILMNIKLKKELIYDKESFWNWLFKAEHKKVFRIKISQTPNILYLCGWNYLDKKNSKGKYPVFSKFNPKLYFNEKVCEDVAKNLTDEGYLVEIV
jgi:hypothetical protein